MDLTGRKRRTTLKPKVRTMAIRNNPTKEIRCSKDLHGARIYNWRRSSDDKVLHGKLGLKGNQFSMDLPRLLFHVFENECLKSSTDTQMS